MGKHQERKTQLEDSITFKKDILMWYTTLKQFTKATDLTYDVVYRAANGKPITHDEKADVLTAYTEMSPDIIQLSLKDIKPRMTEEDFKRVEDIIYKLQCALENREEFWFLEGVPVEASGGN